jgi:hypothetical protein
MFESHDQRGLPTALHPLPCLLRAPMVLIKPGHIWIMKYVRITSQHVPELIKRTPPAKTESLAVDDGAAEKVRNAPHL